jgi:hypothetical protein
MALLPARTPPTKGVIPRKSDEECFSPRTDHQRAETLNCQCGAPAAYGVPVETTQSVMDKAMVLCHFYCAKCLNGQRFSLTCSRMYPSWKIVANAGEGKYWVRHRTEKEQDNALMAVK